MIKTRQDKTRQDKERQEWHGKTKRRHANTKVEDMAMIKTRQSKLYLDALPRMPCRAIMQIDIALHGLLSLLSPAVSFSYSLSLSVCLSVCLSRAVSSCRLSLWLSFCLSGSVQRYQEQWNLFVRLRAGVYKKVATLDTMIQEVYYNLFVLARLEATTNSSSPLSFLSFISCLCLRLCPCPSLCLPVLVLSFCLAFSCLVLSRLVLLSCLALSCLV